jgi:hypothetical protein
MGVPQQGQETEGGQGFQSTLQDSHEAQRLRGEICMKKGSSLLSGEKAEIIDIDDTHQS